MGSFERKSYLIAVLSRYLYASRVIKTKVLVEFCAVCRYNRKHGLPQLIVLTNTSLVQIIATTKIWDKSKNQNINKFMESIVAGHPWILAFYEVFQNGLA